MTKMFAILIVFFSSTICAGEITLKKGQGYIVPDGKLWLIKDAPISKCRVCTADVYVKGDLSNVELNGVVFHGNFTFSFSSAINGAVKLHPGTEIWLGDTREQLIINEQSQ